jgi:hypothetical protein
MQVNSSKLDHAQRGNSGSDFAESAKVTKHSNENSTTSTPGKTKDISFVLIKV